jgi:methylated-DNA-[protein]-cysteine S-methyltransferase
VKYVSPIGVLNLAASGDGLTHCHVRRAPEGDGYWAQRAAGQLDEYFAGERTRFDVPLDLHRRSGADAVILRTLVEATPYGATTTYGALARALPGLDAQRIGAAMAANPLLLFVPCHRVLGAGGRLTGYAAGLAAKRRLLDLEAGQLALELA